MDTIERYIEVLLDKFPVPITQTELAEEASVTKSAVSKIRERLVAICDINTLAYEKRLLLSTNSRIFTQLFFFLVFNRLKPEIILKSRYLKLIVKSWDIHGKLSKGLEELSYNEFFEEVDTDKFVEIALYNLSRIRAQQKLPNNELRKKKKMDELGLLLRIYAYFPIIKDPFSEIDLALFNDEEEMIHLLRLRDKIFRFVMHNSEKVLRNWEVLRNVDEEKKDVYLEAYLKAVEHYVRKYIDQFTSKVQEKAEMKGIGFEVKYSEIGSFYGLDQQM
jgi:hypothetical protein